MSAYLNENLETMDLWKQLLYAFIDEDNDISDVLKQISTRLGLTLKEIAEQAEIPQSTLYKISSADSDTRLSTIKKLVNFVRERERKTLTGMAAVGLITSRDVLDTFGSEIDIRGEKIKIREYLANTIEEEIIMGVRAAKEGIRAIICGPVAANTLKRIVEIPVVGIAFSKASLVEAIEKAIPKL